MHKYNVVSLPGPYLKGANWAKTEAPHTEVFFEIFGPPKPIFKFYAEIYGPPLKRMVPRSLYFEIFGPP